MRHGSGLDGRDVNCKPNLFRILQGVGFYAHLSSVDEVPPAPHKLVQDLVREGLVALDAKCHRSCANQVQTAQICQGGGDDSWNTVFS